MEENYLIPESGARSIHPKSQPVRPGKLVHLKRWTSFFETFPVGPNRSIEFWTGISGNFGWMDRAPCSFSLRNEHSLESVCLMSKTTFVQFLYWFSMFPLLFSISQLKKRENFILSHLEKKRTNKQKKNYTNELTTRVIALCWILKGNNIHTPQSFLFLSYLYAHGVLKILKKIIHLMVFGILLTWTGSTLIEEKATLLFSPRFKIISLAFRPLQFIL